MPGANIPLEVRVAGERDIEAVRSCLAAAFEPYRAAYTPGAFLDTVPDREGLALRMRTMTVLVVDRVAEVGADADAGKDRVERAGVGCVIGTVAYQVSEPGVGHLRGMAVLPEFHGCGAAERLLAAAEAGLRALGCARVTLDTTRPLERAVRFYERRGYRPTGAPGDFHGMPLFEYEKRL